MCGIAGILTTRRDLDLAGPVSRMRDALGHRGPDDAGLRVVQTPAGVRLGLAHTRLAILDLSPAGHQPMTDPDSGSWIVYNGEIYNHESVRRSLPSRDYVSTSDTETLLAGWTARGSDLLPQLRGMFAFGLYDARRDRFWLVRDRLGVKPLYVANAGSGTWLFASEVRAILAAGLIEPRLDTDSRDSYLAFGAVTAPWTLVRGVHSLLPAESWCFDLARGPDLAPVRSRFWRLPFRAPRPGEPKTYDAAVEAIRPVLRDAVHLRMLSDVPVGVFLSGGIDSSSVVATLAAEGRQVTTLSVAFEERSHDESPYARAVARHFGTSHVELVLRSERILKEFDDALASYDQPSVDGLNSYFVSQTARESGVTVALSGLGGDELFAGYPFFRYVARAERRRWQPVARLMRVAVGAGGRTRRLRKLAVLLDPKASRLERYLASRTLIAQDRRGRLTGRPPGDLLPSSVRDELESAVADLDPVNAQSVLELSLYTANTLLRDADQMSMAHALEVRVPLLDHQLVETMATIPGFLKLQPGRSSRLKGLLVDALPAPLPVQAVRRRKRGFVLPWDRWLRGDLAGNVAATLSDRAAVQAAGLDPAAVEGLWREFLAGRPDRSAADVLALVNLLKWTHRHGVRCHEDGCAPSRESSPPA